MQQVKSLIQRGQLNQALIECQQLCSASRKNVQAWYILTDLYLRNNQASKALATVVRAEELEPKQPQIHLLKIKCLLLTGNTRQALISANALFDRATRLLAKDWQNLGLSFHQLNSLAKAHSCFESGVKLEPSNPQYRFNYATSLRNTGQLIQAEEEFQRVLALNPRDWDANLARSLLTKASTEKNHIESLKTLLTSTNSKEAKSKLLFAIAKEQEDCGDYQASFIHLQQANELRKQFTQYDVSHDIEAMDCIRETFPRNAKPLPLDAKEFAKGETVSRPIFIIGLPRTGTTLLERIISQYPGVLAAGELHDFASCLTLAVSQNSGVKLTNKQDFIRQSAEANFSQLGKDYLESTKVLTQGSKWFIDKMPMNFLYTGLIQKALPEAKIIHLTRAPMAACYAIYKTSFGQAYPFSYNMENLANYYIAYRTLMSHWQESSNNNFLEVNYEQLVTSPEVVSKKVFTFLGFEWQPSCLQLEKNRQASATASSSQVRGKIYQSSVDLWRHYQVQLQPLYQQLKQAGINPEAW